MLVWAFVISHLQSFGDQGRKAAEPALCCLVKSIFLAINRAQWLSSSSYLMYYPLSRWENTIGSSTVFLLDGRVTRQWHQPAAPISLHNNNLPKRRRTVYRPLSLWYRQRATDAPSPQQRIGGPRPPTVPPPTSSQWQTRMETPYNTWSVPITVALFAKMNNWNSPNQKPKKIFNHLGFLVTKKSTFYSIRKNTTFHVHISLVCVH